MYLLKDLKKCNYNLRLLFIRRKARAIANRAIRRIIREALREIRYWSKKNDYQKVIYVKSVSRNAIMDIASKCLPGD